MKSGSLWWTNVKNLPGWWQLKYFWNVHPDPWGNDSQFDLRIFFKGGWFNHQSGWLWETTHKPVWVHSWWSWMWFFWVADLFTDWIHGIHPKCGSPTFWENSFGSLVHTVDLDLFFGGDLLLCTMVNQYFSPPFGYTMGSGIHGICRYFRCQNDALWDCWYLQKSSKTTLFLKKLQRMGIPDKLPTSTGAKISEASTLVHEFMHF